MVAGGTMYCLFGPGEDQDLVQGAFKQPTENAFLDLFLKLEVDIQESSCFLFSLL